MAADTGIQADHALIDALLQAQAPAEEAPQTLPTAEAAGAPPVEIAFIDAAVPGADKLAAGLRPGIELVTLDPARDGLSQMAEALRGRTDIAAIHVLGHADDGLMILGSGAWDAAGLDARADDLAAIGRSLAAGGDILLYGCDLGAGAEGAAFLNRMADLTGADVAASTDATGAARLGGDWDLEAQRGTVESAGALTDGAAFDDLLTSPLDGASGWTPVLLAEPNNDSQAKSADTDLIGKSTHAVLYTRFSDNGTAATSDDTLSFRIRINNPTGASTFGGVAVVGVDANNDGRADIFLSVDGRNNGQVIRILDPGTGMNNSPNTTTTAPLPVGWLPNNGVYGFTASNYKAVAVSSTTDPQWDGTTDLGPDGDSDLFVSFSVPMADIATVLAKASPANRTGVVGPRGTAGIAGFTKDTSVRYIVMTQTQPGPLNGDIGGVNGGNGSTSTFAQLGATTALMTPSAPVAAGKGVSVAATIGDGNLSAAEDDSVTISGTATAEVAAGDWVKVTVSDGTNADVVRYVQVTAGKTWTASGVDLSSLNDSLPALSVKAELWTTGTAAGTKVAGSSGGSTTVLHDKTPPVVTVASIATAGTPVISGTSDLAAGSLVTVTVDPDNDSGTADSVVWRTTVGSGGAWSIDTASARPFSGTMASSGLTGSAKITATARDTAGNDGTGTGLNQPTVTALATVNPRPAISGTWTNIAGDVLTVKVGSGTTYTVGANLVVSGNSWTLTPAADLALGANEVVATVTRGGTSVTDSSSNEVTYAAGPTITITGGASVGSSALRPTIAGTSSVLNGTVILRLDPGNDGALSDAVTYSVATNGTGAWTLDTATAAAISGSAPANGFNGAVGVLATASTGAGSATAAQLLTVTQPTIAVSSIVTTASAGNAAAVLMTGDSVLNAAEDVSVKVTGTSTATAGSTVNLVVSDANGSRVTGTATVQAGGGWEATGLNLSTLDNGTLTATATLSGTAISGSNTVTHDKSPPRIFITSNSVINQNGSTITGTSELAAGSTLTVKITRAGVDVEDGTETATVTAGGAWSYASSLAKTVAKNDALVVVVSSTATDTHGNYALAAQDDFTASNGNKGGSGAVTINTIAGDNKVVASEITGGTIISGTVTSGLTAVTLEITDSRGASSLYQTGTITVTGTTWTTTIPEATMRGFVNGDLTILATATDASNEVKSVAKAELSLAPPALTITDNVPGAADGPVTFTFTFAESVTGFAASDVTVTGGTAGALSGSGTTYTMTVTPAANSAGTITLDVAAAAATGSISGRGSLAGTASQVFDTVAGNIAAPTVTVEADGLATATRPIISGTTSLATGASIAVTIDPDNNAGTANSVTYSATVGSGGAWSVDTATAAPTAGTVPTAGFLPYALVTAMGTNAYGASTTATALNVPSVTRQLTNDSTPLVAGTWTSFGSDTLAVQINGVTYTSGNGLTVGTNSWSVQAPALADGTYSVTATATRGGASKTDVTTGELVVDATLPAVAITTAPLGKAAKPIITGTTDLPDGTVLTITLDPDNNAGTANDITYVTVAAGGGWSVDTATALPSGGTLPDAGLNGTVGVKAQGTDAAGNTATDSRTLTVDTTLPVIGFTTNRSTRDTTPEITGTTDLPNGTALTITVNGTVYNTTVQAGGTWSVQVPGALNGTVALTATGVDAAGNSATATTSLIIDTSAPTLLIAEPIGDGSIDGTENGAVPIGGSVQDIDDASVLSVSITDGTTTILDSATVAGGAWAIDPLNIKGLAAGTITVSATYLTVGGDIVRDTASFQHTQASPPTDPTPPVIDLAPTSDDSVHRTFTSTTTGLSGTAISLDDGTAQATVTEASDALTQLRITVGGLVDGTSEKLLFGAGAVNASGGTLAGAVVGGVTVDVAHAGSTFTVTRTGGGNFTAAQVRDIVRALEYRNDAATVSGGSRTFTFATTDAAGNASINATATLALTAPVLNTAPTLTATAANPTYTEGGTAAAIFTGAAASTVEGGQSIASLKFTISGVQAGDRLGLDGSSLAVTADASGTTAGGRTYDIAVAGGTATVTVTGTLTTAQAQALVNGLTLSASGTQPSSGTRTVTLTEVKDNGGTANGGVDTSALAIASTVAMTDVAPDIANATHAVAEASAVGTLVGTVTAADDTNGLSYAITGGDNGGVFSIDGSGQIKVAGTLNFEGTASYTLVVEIDDEDADTTADDTATVTVNVTNVQPSTPADTDDAANSVGEGSAANTAVGITAASTDPAGGTITYSLSDDAGGRFQIGASTGIVTVKNGALLNAANATSHGITVQASDGVLSRSQNFTIAVGNSAPTTPTDGDGTANRVTEGAAANTAVGVTAAATDNGGSVTYSLTDDAGGRFKINATTGVVTVNDASLLNFEAAASHSITVRASDGALHSSQSFTIDVANAAPAQPTDGNGATNQVAEGAAAGTTVGLTLAATDPNGGTVTFALTDDDGGRFQIDAVTGVVSVANQSLLDFEAGASRSIKAVAKDASGTASAERSFTIALLDRTEIKAGTALTEPGSFATANDSAGEATALFDFTIAEGSGDGQGSAVSKIVLSTAGGTATTDPAQIVWRLNGPGVTDAAGTYDAAAQTITFSGLAATIADGDAATFTVGGWYTGGGVVDGNTVKLSLAAGGLTLTGTAIAASQAPVTNGAGFTTDVTATKLVFTSEPAATVTSRVTFATQPVVRATDALGNRDKDFAASVALTVGAGTGTLQGTAEATAAAGTATFTGLRHEATEDKQSFTLTAKATGLTDAVTGTITSDVVADRLVFKTQPAVSDLQSGKAATFTATPTVAAVDAGGVTDKDWATGITLTVTGPAGAAVPGTVNSMSGTGDTDGAAATVTLAPGQGSAAYAGFGLTYTAAGTAPDDIVLKASSGALTVAYSDALKVSTDNTPPSLGNFGNAITYVENAPGAVINASATVTDAQTGAGTMPGAVLTLARQGAPDGQDLFGHSGTLTALTQGQGFSVGGTAVGTVTQNGGGRLVLTFNGDATTALIQETLRQVTYANASDTPPASVTLEVSLNDANPTDAADPAYKAPGGAKTATATTTVAITPVNDAPALSAPATLTVAEDGAAGVSISLSDVDVGVAAMSVQLSASNGTLSLDGGTGGSSSLTLSDSQDRLAALLSGLTYRPNANYSGPATIAVTVSDLGGTGTGGTRTAGATIAVTVTPVNDQPTAIIGGTVPVTEDGPAVTLPAITVADPDAGETITVTLKLADPAAGTLSATTVTGTVAEVNAALSGVSFTPGKDHDQDTSVLVEVRDSGRNGTTQPVTGSIALKFTPVNDPVTVAGLGTIVSYREDGGPAAIGGLSVADADKGETVTVTLGLSDAAAGSLSATSLSGTVAEVNAALAALTFTPAKDVNRDLQLTVSAIDKGGKAPVAGSVTLKGTPVNDAPLLTAPEILAYKQTDGTLSVGGIGVADVDAGEVLTVTLALSDAKAGSLSATTVTGTVAEVNAALGGLTFTPNKDHVQDGTLTVTVRDGGKDGVGPVSATVALDLTTVNTNPLVAGLGATVGFTEDAGPVALPGITVTDPDKGDVVTATLSLADGKAGALSLTSVSGTVEEVNAALAALTFTPAKDHDQDTSVTVEIRDKEGKAPVAGTLTLKATPVNDPVLVAGGGTVTYAQSDGSVALPGLTVSDVDRDEQVTVTLSLTDPAAGTLSATSLAGTVAQVNAALAGLSFTPNKDHRTDSAITVEVRDGLENGTGPATAGIALDVVPLPTGIALGGDGVLENSTGVVATLSALGAGPEARSWSIVSDPSGAFAVQGGQLVQTKALDFEAVKSVALRLATTDSRGQTFAQDVTVAVRDVNEAPAPTVTAADTAAQAGQAVTIAVPAFTDLDTGDAVAVTVSGPSWLSYNAAAGTLSGTPGAGDVGTATVQVTGTDKGGLTATVALRVTVAAPPVVVPPPVITPPPAPAPVVVPTAPTAPVVVAPVADTAPVVIAPVPVTAAPAVTAPALTVPATTPAIAPVVITAPAPAATPAPAADAGAAGAGTAARPGPAATGTPAATAPAPSTALPPNAATTASGGKTGLVTVLPSANAASQPPALMLANPPPDQAAKAGALSSFQLPNGTFQHTAVDAIVTVTATQADGSPLPSWLTFDPQTGTFKGDPPPDVQGTLQLKVTAEDNEGRKAEAKFRLTVGENVEPGGEDAPARRDGAPAQGQAPQGQAPEGQAPEGEPAQPQPAIQPPAAPAQGQRQTDAAPAGKPSLSEQIRTAGGDGVMGEGLALLAGLLEALSGPSAGPTDHAA
ncbi:MAG TPA: DUF4347 domain-containing protein [Azospirillaceae bacterium]|nr:DUF4347 domain-containing protein [Azospirillaceae bacterium]